MELFAQKASHLRPVLPLFVFQMGGAFEYRSSFRFGAGFCSLLGTLDDDPFSGTLGSLPSLFLFLAFRADVMSMGLRTFSEFVSVSENIDGLGDTVRESR